MAISSNAGLMFFGAGEMFVAMVLNAVWGVLFCLCAFLLIPTYSTTGLGLSYLSSYLALTAIQLYYQSMKWGIRFPHLKWATLGTVFVFGIAYSIEMYTVGLIHTLLASVLLLLVIGVEVWWLPEGTYAQGRRVVDYLMKRLAR
jgi:hypothetical protein